MCATFEPTIIPDACTTLHTHAYLSYVLVYIYYLWISFFLLIYLSTFYAISLREFYFFHFFFHSANASIFSLCFLIVNKSFTCRFALIKICKPLLCFCVRIWEIYVYVTAAAFRRAIFAHKYSCVELCCMRVYKRKKKENQRLGISLMPAFHLISFIIYYS